MQILFLGTGAMVPTRERNVSGVLLEYEGEYILFDCGEGTQRQMNLAGYNRVKARKILITHWHGDHVSGLIGLIQTLGHIPDPGSIQLIGPKGTEERLYHLMNSVYFDRRLDIKVIEADPKKPAIVFSEDRYDIWAVSVEHSVPTLAYAFVEKDRTRIDTKKASQLGLSEGPLLGKLSRGLTVNHEGRAIKPEQVTYSQPGRKVVYVMDTNLTDGALRLAEDADVLICESTFLAEEHQDKAEEYGHLSARDAAQLARDANAKKLFLTHFSQRYADVGPLLEEARQVFPSTEAAHDFLLVELPKKPSGKH